MNFYTAHLRQGAAPVLLPEGFSLAAAMFGPFWFAERGAWIEAGAALAGWVLVAAFAQGGVLIALAVVWAWLLGLFAHDLLRARMQRRGYLLAHVVAARDEEAAFGRLLAARPELGASLP